MLAAVILAAGTGDRFRTEGQVLPKQYLPLNGRPLLTWSLSALAAHAGVAKIVVAVSVDMLGYAKDISREHLAGASEKIEFIIGGATRQDSVRIALEYLDSQTPAPQQVMVHDAARPFLTPEMIDGTIEAAITHGACTLAIPITDTVKKVKAGLIVEALDRSELFAIQTPQAGRFQWLLDGHRLAQSKRISCTDDASILELSGHQVFVVKGSTWNLKVTNPDDLLIASAMAPLAFRERAG